MKKNAPKIGLKVPDKNKPNWGFNFWPFLVMLLLLWGWQVAVEQFTVRTIPYSEFRAYLARREVADAVVRQDEIIGEIVPRGSSVTNLSIREVVEARTN